MAADPTPSQDSMRNAAPSSPPSDASPLFQSWQAEAVRLREAHWGPLEDRMACQSALKAKPDLATRILARAAWLAGHSGLGTRLAQWATSARWALIALWVAAGLAGMGAAATALGQPQGAINLSLALLALLGLHTLTFLIWLASYLPGIPASTALSRLWLWLTKRLAHGPDSALAAQAFVSLMARARAWRSLLGLVSHGAWTLAFLGMLPTLVILLSTRRYTFHWETTLLSPETFVALTHSLGAWPRLLGFSPPGAFEVAASVSSQPLTPNVQADWSWWLIGCVLAWGLLPRLVALLACALHLRRRLRQPLIDTHLPGWLELRERLLPTHQNLGIDKPAPAEAAPRANVASPQAAEAQAAILAHELGAGLTWPPADLPPGILDMGRCDSREDRTRIRMQLDSPPAHLLLVCDARLTPDRGTRAWLEELRHCCPDLQVLCQKTDDEASQAHEGPGHRLRAWTALLATLGIPQAADLNQWLTRIGMPHHG
ncbi:hypothetical protein CDEF62S_05100 [Castellaniella defragrans]